MIRRLAVTALLVGLSMVSAGSMKAVAPHFGFGGLTVGAGYSYYSGGPFWGYPYWGYNDWAFAPWGYYSAAFYPFYSPGFLTGYAYAPGYGEVKLKSVSKTASVFIDGAYAGNAAKLKSIWLAPGVYQFRVEDNGEARTRKVYVLSGKTLSISKSELEKTAD